MSTLDRKYDLPAFSELRIRTPPVPDTVKIMVHLPVTPQKIPRALAGDGSDPFLAEAGIGTPLTSSITLPKAEVFGSELIPGVPVTLPALQSLAVFTPTGCQLTVTASPFTLQDCYATTGGAVWMRSLTDVHAHLEAARQNAKQNDDFGPRVLFVSDQKQVGVSTYVKLLSQFAVRIGYHPLLLDGALEGWPAFGFPGCFSLYQLQYPLDVEEGMNLVPGIHTFMGAPRSRQPQLYVTECRHLAAWGNEKMSRWPKSRVGGLMVDYGVIDPHLVLRAEAQQEANEAESASNSPYSMSSMGSEDSIENPLDTLLQVMMELDIDQVFVVQSAWLRFKIGQRALEKYGVGKKELLDNPQNALNEVVCENGFSFKLFLLDPVGVGRLPYPDSRIRRQHWVTHFFGTPTSPLQPSMIQLELWIPGNLYQDAHTRSRQEARVPGKVRIVTLGTIDYSMMSTLVPMSEGESSSSPARDPCAVTFIPPLDVQLKGRILAISTANEFEALPDGSMQPIPFSQFEAEIKKTTIKGFVLVESVSEDKLTVVVGDSKSINKELGVCFFLCEEIL